MGKLNMWAKSLATTTTEKELPSKSQRRSSTDSKSLGNDFLPRGLLVYPGLKPKQASRSSAHKGRQESPWKT
eukprot:6477537-Amphidinium_carterae.2